MDEVGRNGLDDGSIFRTYASRAYSIWRIGRIWDDRAAIFVRRSEPDCTLSKTRREHAMTTVRRQTGVGSLAGLHPLWCAAECFAAVRLLQRLGKRRAVARVLAHRTGIERRLHMPWWTASFAPSASWAGRPRH